MYKKYLTFALTSILLLVPLFLPDDESRFDEWSKSLLCPVCQGETIYDSPSEYADDMRSILQEQINNNMTCLLYTSPSPRDSCASRMPSSA